jgi:hypothetical protein
MPEAASLSYLWGNLDEVDERQQPFLLADIVRDDRGECGDPEKDRCEAKETGQLIRAQPIDDGRPCRIACTYRAT